MAVRFDDALNREIKRTFKNFNAKRNYNQTKTRGRGMLPNPVSAKKFKEKYSDKTRAEIMKQLKLYQSFGKRDALKRDDTSRLSKWEREFFESNRAKTEAFYINEIADLERIIGNKPEYHLRLHHRLNDLKDKLSGLNANLDTLTEKQIEGLRSIYSYAERSELVKQQGFRLYLKQVERVMHNLEYDQVEIDELLNKFNVLSENEFTEMVRNEDLIDRMYDLINSPKGRGKYELTVDREDAESAVERLKNNVDSLIKKYKKHD